MKDKNHSDAAKKAADTYNLHRIAKDDESIGKWIAVALQDGSSDNTLYDSKSDAISHQRHNENFYTFVCIRPTSMNVCEAEVMLNVARRAYDAGLRMTDPSVAKRDIIKRLTVEDQMAQMRGIASNLIIRR